MVVHAAVDVDELTMSLLAAGIPLTLLLDLAESFGPPSAAILAEEGTEIDLVPLRLPHAS